eukprot:5070901-Prymnesium_polylepis.1
MLLLGQAADRGSAGAAWDLGKSFDEGTQGLPKDPVQANMWYEKVATAKKRDLDPEYVEEAAARVRELSS